MHLTVHANEVFYLCLTFYFFLDGESGSALNPPPKYGGASASGFKVVFETVSLQLNR
jgi:hypothetical protein